MPASVKEHLILHALTPSALAKWQAGVSRNVKAYAKEYGLDPTNVKVRIDLDTKLGTPPNYTLEA